MLFAQTFMQSGEANRQSKAEVVNLDLFVGPRPVDVECSA